MKPLLRLAVVVLTFMVILRFVLWFGFLASVIASAYIVKRIFD